MWPDLTTRFGLLAAAMAIEVAAGYPDALYRSIGHPVTWIGALIGWLEALLNADGQSRRAAPHPSLRATFSPGEKGREALPLILRGEGGRPARKRQRMGPDGRNEVRTLRRRLPGVLALLVLLSVTIAIAFALQSALGGSRPGLAMLAVVVSTLVATRSLDTHVGAVVTALETGGIEAGRKAVSQIVGRDPQALDEAGVCRAAIESLAENFSDGVAAPAFWFAVAGLPGMMAYKAINTADSMIGHMTPRYLHFGWAAARVDDLVNLPASRLTALLIAMAASTTHRASTAAAFRTIWRDAGKHRSPNAGWPEAAMAGALGLQLAGPRSYGGVMSTDPPMGDGRAALRAADIRQALQLYRLAAGVLWVAIALAAAACW